MIGARCDRATPAEANSSRHGCVRSAHGGVGLGWSMYSVERFYPAPLVWDVTCVGAAAGGISVSFTTVNSFKMNALKPGMFELIADGASAPLVPATAFEFERFWRGTNVMFATAAANRTFEGHLVVTNQVLE